MDTDTELSPWHLTPDLDGALAGIGSAIVLTLGATQEQPEQTYVWFGDPDDAYSSIADSASDLCETEERGGHLDLITGDDGPRRIATINRDGGWRMA